MRALVATGPGQLQMADVSEPVASAGQVLVRSRVTAVSAGTELRMLYDGRAEHGPDPQWPVVGAFGYLVAGDVMAVGPEVSGVKVGDRVACGRTWGAHREIVETAATQVQLLPEDMSYLDGACAYWAVPPLCGILAGRPDFYADVAVVGLGPLGIAAVQMLAPFCRTVVAVDRVRMRCDSAARYGAVAVDGSLVDAAAAVREVLADGAAVVIQAAGSQAALDLCLDVVSSGGCVVNVGTLPTLSGIDLFWPMQLSGARLVPIYRPAATSTREEDGALGLVLRERYLPDVIEMMRRGRLDIGALCTWCVPIERGPAAFELLRAHPERCLGLAFAWDDAEVKGLAEFIRATQRSLS
jgi:threonine dehydrogenase-like Zn-dependent dehydrogenase